MTKPHVGIRIMYSSIWIAALALGFIIIVRLFAQPPSGTAKRTAFTAVVKTVSSRNGQQIDERLDTDSFLADGSYIHIANSFNNEPLGWRSIINIQNRKRVVLDVATASVTTYNLGNAEYALATAMPTCSGAPAGTILGYTVIKVSQTVKHGINQTRKVSLVAPALNCYPLSSSTDLLDSNGSIMQHADVRVTAVLIGEVARTELNAQPGYTERAPSEVRTIRANQEGRECTQCELSGNVVLDDVYKSHKN